MNILGTLIPTLDHWYKQKFINWTFVLFFIKISPKCRSILFFHSISTLETILFSFAPNFIHAAYLPDSLSTKSTSSQTRKGKEMHNSTVAQLTHTPTFCWVIGPSRAERSYWRPKETKHRQTKLHWCSSIVRRIKIKRLNEIKSKEERRILVAAAMPLLNDGHTHLYIWKCDAFERIQSVNSLT